MTTAEERFNRLAATAAPQEPISGVDQRESHDKLWLNAKLEAAEKLWARRQETTYDAGGFGGAAQDEAILSIVRDCPRITASRIVARLLNPTKPYAAINRLVNCGRLIRTLVDGLSRKLELHSVAGIYYDGTLYKSARELAAHKHNAQMHGKPLSHVTISDRLNAGLPPALALLRPRGNDGRGGGRSSKRLGLQ